VLRSILRFAAGWLGLPPGLILIRTGVRHARRAHFTPACSSSARAQAQQRAPLVQCQQGRYIADVQEPMLRFIADFATPLARISKNFDADPRPSGGSMFRIYATPASPRTRRLQDHVAAHFRHKQTSADVHGPASTSISIPAAASSAAASGCRSRPRSRRCATASPTTPRAGQGAARVKEIEGAADAPAPGLRSRPSFIDDLKRKSSSPRSPSPMPR